MRRNLWILLSALLALVAVPSMASADVPGPGTSPIRHVVVIYQENHSFDNVFGVLCVTDHRCDGTETGLLSNGQTIPLGQAADVVSGVDHHVLGQLTAIDGGAMDGWDEIRGCTQKAGYRCFTQFVPSQIPNLAALARGFALSDRTFEMSAAASFGAHVDLVAGQLDGFTGDTPGGTGLATCGPTTGTVPWRATPSSPIQVVQPCVPFPDGSGAANGPTPVQWVPTIMDEMTAAGVSWQIFEHATLWSLCTYFADCLENTQAQRDVSTSNTRFYNEAAAGTLPAVTFLSPAGKVSQHNAQSMLAGDNYIGQVVQAIENGPDWASTAIFITYDDCGCFYDHVPPPTAGLGVRVPMVIVSPYAKAGFTDSTVASNASILAFIEHTFGLAPLNTTDGAAYDYGDSFNFSQQLLHGISLHRHPVPLWERHYLEAHPEPPDPT